MRRLMNEYPRTTAYIAAVSTMTLILQVWEVVR